MKALAAALLFLISVGLVLFLLNDQKKPGDREREIRRENVFVRFAKDQIREIDLTGPEGRLRLSRDADGNAQIKEPFMEAADPSQVDGLLGALELATVARVVGVSHPAMDPPLLRGSISMGTLSIGFRVGGDAPSPEGAHYFQVEGEKVVVVGKEFVATLLRGADAYREKGLIRFSMNDVDRFEIGAPNGERTMFRSISPERFVLSSNGFLASRSALDQVAHALADLRAEHFLQEQEGKRAENDALIEVAFDVREKKRVRILLGGACPDHPDDVAAVRTEPLRIAACVPKNAIRAFQRTDWVERAPLTLRFDEVEEIRIDGSAPFEAVRVGGGWKERRPEEEELDSAHADRVAEFILGYTRAGAESVAKGEPSNEGTVLTFRGHDRTETLRVFKSGAKVLREADSALLTFRAKDATILAPSLP